MTDPNFILLYVSNATESAAFYQRLLGRAPVEASPTFAMFALESGVMLGLWGRDGVLPAATPVGGSELAFAVADDTQVLTRHQAWTALGLPTLQAPTRLDFGFTFVAADPDGHRLRVFAPGAQ
ncbi:VOC family protein [Ideonella sp. BN130291]|uniref:VOC family protein n=1 Tax=Ideonella sp. BN130291 TaxID=3112940 RepID=UPI002E26E0A4|nr:VOC family protein [Ideonella sp. BN130291]